MNCIFVIIVFKLCIIYLYDVGFVFGVVVGDDEVIVWDIYFFIVDRGCY